ncbi:unnamed protein product, partial [Heterotrigona itama]
MNKQNSTIKLVLFISLLFTRLNSIHTQDLTKPKNVSPNDDVKPVEEFIEESSTEDQFSLESTTTTESTTTVETYHKLKSINAKKNISREFRPSVHLGVVSQFRANAEEMFLSEIKESRVSTSPFNALRHFNFDNAVNPGSYHEHVKDFQVIFQPAVKTVQTLQTPRPANQENIHQNLYETAVGSTEESKKDGAENGYVKFQDDALDASRVPYSSSKDQTGFHQQVSNSLVDNSGTQYDLMDQQIHPNLEKPVFEQETSIIWGKPSKFQSEPQRPELNVNSLKKPYFPIVYDHQDQQSSLQDFDLSKKPNDGVVLVQESSFMRTRKYPYPYQSYSGYNQAEFLDDKRSSMLKKRVSPWKKIFHLIGAILPLGLLIAALTPNVVKVDNTTQPNIVLSKWRVADLPVEHKQARFNDPLSDCEEKSICGMILAGGDVGATVLQNILWNLAT